MKVRRSSKFSISIIFPFLISFFIINFFAGAAEVHSFNPWTMSVGVFGTIYGADFKYEPTFSLNVGGTPTFKILLLPIPSSLVTVGEDMWGV